MLKTNLFVFLFLIGIFFARPLCAKTDEYANLDKPVMEDIGNFEVHHPGECLLKNKNDYFEMMKSLSVKIFPHTDDRAPHRKDTVLHYLKFKSAKTIKLIQKDLVVCQSKVIVFNEINGVDNLIRCVDENIILNIESQNGFKVFDYQMETDGSEPIQVIRGKRENNYFYWGKLALKVESKKLLLVNIIHMEDYIKGVVPGEIYVSWPFETISAQAVAARSYALYQLSKVNQVNYFHFDDTTSFQVYIGDISYYKRYQLEQPSKFTEEEIVKIKEMLEQLPEFFKAIERTRSEVMLLEKDEIFQAYFHAASGGYTVDAEALNFSDCLPCKEVEDYQESDILGDDFAMENLYPQEFWEIKRTHNDVEKRLKVSDLISDLLTLDAIFLPEDGYADPYKTSGGHYVKVPLRVSGKLRVIKGYPFKSSMGLKNVRYDIIRCGSDYVFKGRGYGHSVGMSQWGAYFKGRQGATYLDILNHYYKKVKITRF